ncbi:MAG: hypothetical protein OXF48_06195 [Bacteroidetes bacterium]|nr:hypothetical protein [Bacteroidota bacterium]
MTIEEIETLFTRVESAEEFAFIEQTIESYQRSYCEVYRRFRQKYLPVSAFKHAEITTFPVSEAERIFLSSSTGSDLQSRHFVRQVSVYEASVCGVFEAVFGNGSFTIWAHLPGYASESSLVCMMEILMRKYGDEGSRFFLKNELPEISRLSSPLLLFGAAFGLLNLSEAGPWKLPERARIVETGGMKTYRREVTRSELHTRLAKGFGITNDRVWSEYGMCELLSQAYAQGGMVYVPPPWMRVRVVNPNDPGQIMQEGEPGLLAITDLANMYTVSSILTEDLGVRRGKGFEVLGRFPGSALRGCNFLIEDL